jgi:hypothetical protein
MKIKFSPAIQEGVIYSKLPFEETLAQIADEDKYVDVTINSFEDASPLYRVNVNIGASRLRAIKKSPECACCGIRANECSVDLDVKATKKTNTMQYHINFYALTGNSNRRDQQHMILFTKDHVVPRSKGGEDSEENTQVLCFNCNTFKLNSEITLDQMKGSLFSAYRAYQSSKSLKLAKSKLTEHYYRLERGIRSIAAINNALLNLTDERVKSLEEKRNNLMVQVEKLKKYIFDVEAQAQKTGIVPEIVTDWK